MFFDDDPEEIEELCDECGELVEECTCDDEDVDELDFDDDDPDDDDPDDDED